MCSRLRYPHIFIHFTLKLNMPVIIKDFTWKQSEDIIFICVPLKGTHYSKVDILISDKYLKLHFPPFLFEVFLMHPINEVTSKCSFTEKEAFLELSKCEAMLWDKLEDDVDKSNKLELKLKAIEDIQNKTRKQLDERIQMKQELDRFAVKEAIQYDTKKRNEIDELRNKEREKAMTEFEEWRQSKSENVSEIKKQDMLEKKGSNEGVIITEIDNESNISSHIKSDCGNLNSKTSDVTFGITDSHVGKGSSGKKSMIKLIVQSDTNATKIPRKHSQFYEKVISDIETRVIPAPRQSKTLNVSFTERIFPTPSRESSARDEEIWLKNVTEARRATGFVSEDLRPEERDPQWCKDKGDEFFRMGNFLGAISAYSHGIKLSSKLPSLYSNRAACQFAIGNFNKCIEDCSTALDLLKPACEANLGSRVKCITRRAAALTRVGMLSKAIEEMKAAVRLQPSNEELKKDLVSMERAWEQDPDSD